MAIADTSVLPATPAVSDGDIRADLKLIADIVPANARLLDIGCGDGALLDYLAREKHVDGRGIELSQAGVNACVRHGLSVIQGDADTDLVQYPTGAFDYVVLTQTLQATRRPDQVLEQLVRIGRHAIVSFSNFGHWRTATQLLLHGTMPALDGRHAWFDSPNIHLCTIADFAAMAETLGIAIEQAILLDRRGRRLGGHHSGRLSGWFADQAVFVLSRRR
jgi:methionine biosynthesis protein MetW